MNQNAKSKMNAKTHTKTNEKTKVNGVILIDKPKGISSQQVVSKVKYLFMSPTHNSKKAGHTGTLDPMATGLLPVCMGEATKFSHYQLDADKAYQATIKLGEQTDTGDAEGKVIATKAIAKITEQQLATVESQFLGELMQVPPMYSALKKDGKKLYEYARAGEEVERPARPIHIRNLSLELISPNEIMLTVTCSKGTYVRVLGEDIAMALGTLGHLTTLRRTAVGEFSVDDAIGLEELESLPFTQRFEQLLAVDVCLGDTPIVYLDEEQIKRIRNGQRLNVFKQIDPQSLATWFSETNAKTTSRDVRLYGKHSKEFVGLGLLEKGGRLQPKKVLNLG